MASKSAEANTTHPSAPAALKPEEMELLRKRDEQTALESELADRELRATNLRAELAAFERRFLHLVGLRYAELDEYKAQLAERLAAAQPNNTRAQQSAEDARAGANETKSGAGDQTDEVPTAFKASTEMKRLYRDVAKHIHPDLTADRKDRATRQQLMARANQAYETGDETTLTKILAEYESRPEAIQGDGPGAELVRVIRRISQVRGRLSEIEAESQALLRSDLHQLRMRVEEGAQNGRDVLAEMMAKTDAQIAEAKRRLTESVRSG